MVDVVPVASTTPDTSERATNGQVIPLSDEFLDVAIKQVVTGTVDVSTVTRTREVAVDEVLTRHTATAERVAIGRIVEAAPDIREENGVLIIPVIEEVAVVEKRLFLKEEIRIHRGSSTHHHRETVTLRRQEVVVQRTPATGTSSAALPGGAVNTPEEIIP